MSRSTIVMGTISIVVILAMTIIITQRQTSLSHSRSTKTTLTAVNDTLATALSLALADIRAELRVVTADIRSRSLMTPKVLSPSLPTAVSAAEPISAGAAAAAAAGAPVRDLPAPEKALREAQMRVNYTSVWMSPMEVNMLLRYLVSTTTYLEWGSGGSTTNFAQFAKEKSFSIEHNLDWCTRMRDTIRAHPFLTRLDYRCKNVSRGYRGWGTQSPEEGTYVSFQHYIDEIDHLGMTAFDFVLVDGRARVDCAIKALSYIRNDSVVALHDAERLWYTDNTTYRPVLEYYDMVDLVTGYKRQGLSVLRRKDSYYFLQGNHSAVQTILNRKYLLPDL